MNSIIRRDFLKQALTYSIIPILSGVPISALGLTTKPDSSPDSLKKTGGHPHLTPTRLAILGPLSSGAQTYANILKHSFEVAELPVLTFHDTHCMSDAKEKMALYSKSLKPSTHQEQIKDFESAIEKLNSSSELSAIFSFRTPFQKNLDLIAKKLLEQNFKVVFVEPENIKKSAAEWYLTIHDIENSNNTGSSIWQKSFKDWSYGKISANPDIVAYYKSLNSNINQLKSLLPNHTTVKMTNNSDLLLAQKLLGDGHLDVWRETTFNGKQSLLFNNFEVFDRVFS